MVLNVLQNVAVHSLGGKKAKDLVNQESEGVAGPFGQRSPFD